MMFSALKFWGSCNQLLCSFRKVECEPAESERIRAKNK